MRRQAEHQQKPALREIARYVLATGKTLTLKMALELLRLNAERTELFDPERKNQYFPAATEPRSSSAEKAVEFKLLRALELYFYQSLLEQDDEENPEESQRLAETLFLAGDVLLFVNGEECHSPAHDLGEEVSTVPTKDQLDELEDRFGKDKNSVQWQIAFGAAEQHGRATAGFILELELPRLRRMTLQKYFNPHTSAGIDVTKLREENYPQRNYVVKFDRDDLDGMPAPTLFAERLIVAKVPTEEMIEELRAAIHEERPAVFSQQFFFMSWALSR